MRDLTAGMQSAVASDRSTLAYLFRIETSGGDVMLATAATDIGADVGEGVETWQGIGGALHFPAIEETTDSGSEGVELTLSGVDQSIIAIILGTHVRGRDVTIWLAMLDDNSQVISSPQPIFKGMQLADYRITETRARDGGTCEVKTRVQSRMAIFSKPAPVRTNSTSHNDMLARAGLPTGDTFFDTVHGIAGRRIRWGTLDILRGSQ